MNRSIRCQSGFSLVELMVSLVISLVAILSILSLFQGLSRNSTETKFGARLDGQVQLGLLTAHKLLEGAGFDANSWSTPNYGNDLLLVQDASVNSEDGTVSGTPVTTLSSATTITNTAGTASSWALVWRANGTLMGLYSPTGGGLHTLTSTDANLGWTNGNTWTLGNTVIPAPPANAANLQASGRVSITVTPTACQPAGLQLGTLAGGNVVVTLTATGYAAGAAQSSTTCLINY